MPILKHYTIPRLILFFILIVIGVPIQAHENIPIIDDLEDRDIERILALVNQEPDNLAYSLELSEKLAQYYYRNNQYNNALENYHAALEAAIKLEENDRIIKFHYNIGLLYTKLGNFPLAIDFLTKILEDKNHDIQTEHFRADLHGELATAYLYMGDYPSSSTNQIEALRIREGIKDTLGIGKSQYTFGTMYFQQENYIEAQKYYEQALNTWQLKDYKGGIYSCYAALGSAYSKLGDPEKSLKNNLIALELAEQLQHPPGIAYALHNVGENYQESGALSKANDYFQQSLSMMEKLKDKNGQIILLESIGNFQLLQGEFSNSLETLQSALQLALEIGASPRMQQIYLVIAQNYDHQGDFTQAYLYKEKYIHLKDSLLNESDLELINQMQINYRLKQSRKEQKISHLKQQSELQNIYFIIGIAIIFLLLFSIAIGYIRYQIRLKKTTLLQVKEDTIHIEKEEIKDSNEDLERFVYVAAHDLREPLRMIGSYSKILDNHLRKVSSDDTKNQLREVQGEAKKMEKLLNDLLEYSRLDRHKETLSPVDMNEMLNIAQRKQYQNITKQKAVIQANNLPIIQAYPKQVPKLFGLILDNSIKFRQEEVVPHIQIECEEEVDQFIFKITDNGVGIPQDKQAAIFDLFKRGHTDSQYEGTGFGLAYCKKVMDNHKGKIWVESQPKGGSTFFLSFPNPTC